MSKVQIIKHVLTLVLSFGGVAWFIWRYEFTASQVAYAGALTTALMLASIATVIGLGVAILAIMSRLK